MKTVLRVLVLVAAGAAAILWQYDVPVRELFRTEPVSVGRPLGEAEVAALARELGSPDLERARAAAGGLAAAGSSAAPALDALIAAVERGDARLRLLAVTALGAIGPAAGRAAPVVARLLADPNKGLVEAAIRAMQCLQPDAEATRAVLPGLLYKGAVCGNTLYRVAPALHPRAAFAWARQFAGDRQTRFAALGFISNLRELPPEAGALFRAVLAEDDVQAVFAATSAMGHCCRDAASVNALVERIRTGPDFVRAFCVGALGEMGPAAASARQTLLDAVRSDDGEAAARAAAAFARVGGDRVVAASALLRALQGARYSAPWVIAEAFLDIGVPSEEVLAKLRQIEENSKPNHRAWVSSLRSRLAKGS